jgi:ArsR family transcriptional regulator, arsenate/arsenite/antimonite-responsive transcriptional repressor / arsenate reductase (thioredoxin)
LIYIRIVLTKQRTPQPVPSFIGLAGHPVRWGLLTELARSDRHVNELTHLIDQPQALVSYHLGRLREGGLVTCRRSGHDGRASYYSVDLTRCGDALAATGASLHPGLALQTVSPAVSPRHRTDRARVLFACTGNGARSQIAEALLQHVAGDRVDVVSGGSHPKPIHPNAIKVLAERGIDIGDRHSKPLAQFDRDHFDYIVTLCDKVREACPEFSTRAQAMHWSIEDPSRTPGGNRATYPVFRALAVELESRIGYLIALIDTR